jgi:hypothetical protein
MTIDNDSMPLGISVAHTDSDIFYGRHEVNKPNNKSTQIFHLFNYTEAAHAIGKHHTKIAEWMCRPGISNVEVYCEEKGNKCLIISGNPKAVNALKIEIRKWILRCNSPLWHYV